MERKNKDSHCLFPYLFLLNKKAWLKHQMFTIKFCIMSGWLSGPDPLKRLCHSFCLKERKMVFLTTSQKSYCCLGAKRKQRNTSENRTHLVRPSCFTSLRTSNTAFLHLSTESCKGSSACKANPNFTSVFLEDGV